MARPVAVARPVPRPRTVTDLWMAVPHERRQAAVSLLAALLTALAMTALAAVAVGHGLERVALEVVGMAQDLDPRSGAEATSAMQPGSAALAAE